MIKGMVVWKLIDYCRKIEFRRGNSKKGLDGRFRNEENFCESGSKNFNS